MVVELGFNSTSVKIPKVAGSIVVAIRHKERPGRGLGLGLAEEAARRVLWGCVGPQGGC